MKLINFVAFLVSTKYCVAADLGNANSILDNPIFEGDDAGQDKYNGLQPGRDRLGGTTYQQPSFLDVGKQQMCERCARHRGCESGYCSWNWVCYDANKKGANGCVCVSDSNCQSGRCSKNLRCAPLVEDGGSCLRSNDCESGYCGLDRVCHFVDCKDEKDIPFMVTNVELTQDGKEHFWGYHSNDFEKEIKFLKNVRYCSAYRIYGQVITKEEFKEEVTAYIKSSTHFDHVFYYIHGFANQPKDSFSAGFNQKNFHDSGYLVIPVNWRNRWGTKGVLTGVPVAYEYDRNISAPRAGRQLAVAIDMFDIDVPVSIMCHSMGNYVFRVMAQNVSARKKVFENVFMVAADARLDMFSTPFNPGAPKAQKEMVGYSNFNFNTKVDSDTEIPYYDELKKNGGLAITELTKNHVHVTWNSDDSALHIRELFQISWSGNIRKALGKFGDQAKAMTTLTYFKNYVEYHNCTEFGKGFTKGHNYMFKNKLKDLYVSVKPQLDIKLLEQHGVKEE